MAIPKPLRDYLLVQKKFDIKIMRILEQSAQDLQRRIARLKTGSTFSESVRANQLRLVLAEVRREQLEMLLSIGDVVRAGQLAAAIEAVDDLAEIAKVVFASVPTGPANEFIGSLRASAEAGIKNLYARTPRELSRRLYKDAAWSTGKIEEAIRNGLVRGASARELAKDVYKFVSPTAPGGVSHVALRLARTEINNAFHNQQIQGMEAPGVEGAKWNLSGSHKVPDECNRLAQADQFNMGAGVFPPGKVPGKPHPQCLCYLTYVTVTPEEFIKGLHAGKYDDELRKRYNANLAALKG